MKKVLISVGPIPAKLDSVKIITNKFKGGLAAKTATRLSNWFDVTVIKWEGTQIDFPNNIHVKNIKDIYSYMYAVSNTPADAYVLAAAVANLEPVNPFLNKFPSHLYKPGDTINIEFTITPRIIDKIRIDNPNKTLIGYKLLDEDDTGLILAGRKLLAESKANVVFCNNPSTAKEKKIALTQDGAAIEMSFDEHIDFIRRVIDLQRYHTRLISGTKPVDYKGFRGLVAELYSKGVFDGGYGTIAKRYQEGFITTARGKKGNKASDPNYLNNLFEHNTKKSSYVSNISDGIVIATDNKATLNAPMINDIFNKFEWADYVLHAHKQLSQYHTYDYVFPGTSEEVGLTKLCTFNIKHHGYYVALATEEDVYEWVEKHHKH